MEILTTALTGIQEGVHVYDDSFGVIIMIYSPN